MGPGNRLSGSFRWRFAVVALALAGSGLMATGIGAASAAGGRVATQSPSEATWSMEQADEGAC